MNTISAATMDKIDAVLDKADYRNSRTEDLKDCTVKFEGRNYKISFKNNSIDVSRKGFSLLGLFKKNYSEAIKERLKARIQPKDFNVNNNFNTIKNFIESKKLKVAIRKEQEVGVFGMKDNTEDAMLGIDKLNEKNKPGNGNKNLIKGTKIETYNDLLGLDKDSVYSNYAKAINMIKKRTIGKNLNTDQVDDPYNKKTAQDWKDFLCKNAKRVDIFGKVADYIAKGTSPAGPSKKTGWAAEVKKYGADKMIESFLKKQIQPNFRGTLGPVKYDNMVSAFKECIDANKANKLTEKKLDAIIEKHLGQDNTEVIFRDALSTAFFRQTSKLGLEFYRSKGIQVVFQWSDAKGKSLDNKSGKAEINDKWWLNGYKDKNNIAEKYGSITLSEMRHVERLQNRDHKENMVLKVAGHNVDFADE